MNPDSSVGQLIQRYDHDPYDHDTFFATSCRLQTHEDFGKFPAISGLHPLLRYHIHVDTKYCAKDSCTNIQNITCHDLLTYVQCICMYICICAYIYILFYNLHLYIHIRSLLAHPLLDIDVTFQYTVVLHFLQVLGQCEAGGKTPGGSTATISG